MKISKIIICNIPYFKKPTGYSVIFANFELYYHFVKRFSKFGRMSVHKVNLKNAIAYKLSIKSGLIDNGYKL